MTEPTQLHALADGELDAREAQALRDALRDDPRAAAEVDAILNLKDLVAKHAAVLAEPEVWKACVARLDAVDKTRRVEGFVGRYAWALCGALFLFILSGRVAMRNAQGDSGRVRDVASIFGPGRAASPRSRLQNEADQALLRQVRQSLDPREIQVGVPLRGLVMGRPALRVPMRDRRGDLALTRIEGTLNLEDTSPTTLDPALSVGVMGGQSCLVWHAGGGTLVLSGDRSADALREVAGRITGPR